MLLDRSKLKNDEQLGALSTPRLLALFRVERHKCSTFEKKHKDNVDFKSDVEFYNVYVKQIKTLLDTRGHISTL